MTDNVATWDFETALAETIRERYAGQYVRIVEVRNVSLREIAQERALLNKRGEFIETDNWKTLGF